MHLTLAQVLPSLSSLGDYAYWLIGLGAALEAWFVTGVFVPGTLVVEAGGILVRQGSIDFFDLVWFVAVFSILGGEASYWTGRLVRRGIGPESRFMRSRAYDRAQSLFARHGAKALMIGRFMGPVAGLISLAAAVTGMNARSFRLWNALSSVPYALAHVALGYFVGDVFSRVGPAFTRYALIAAGSVAGVALVWWIVLRIVRLMPVLRSILRTAMRAVLDTPEIRDWTASHPTLSRHIAGRFASGRFKGLPLTFLGGAFIYLMIVWAETVFDFVSKDATLLVDERIANLAHAFWTPGLLSAATWITAFGEPRVIAALFVAGALWLLLSGRRDLAAGFATAMMGNALSVALLKTIFHRPRPALAYYAETTNSFPSGHAAFAVAFWGMAVYLAWRLTRMRLPQLAPIGASIAFAIGMSRVFLLEHYMSDVVNGWVVGGLWLVVGVAVCEWLSEINWRAAPAVAARQVRLGTFTVMIGLTGFAGWNVVDYEKSLNAPDITMAEQTVPDVAAMRADPSFAHQTEGLLGDPLEPVNLILVAANDAELVDALARAGWTQALAPMPGPLMRAAFAAWTNRPDDMAPVTPYFWGGQPNDYAFEKATADKTLRIRHHVRVWHTPYQLADGRHIYVAAASFDDGLDFGIYHHIDPNIDAERDTLAGDLIAAGARDGAPITMSEPRLGQSVAGDPWFTDGLARVLTLTKP